MKPNEARGQYLAHHRLDNVAAAWQKSGCKTCTVNALGESRARSELPRVVVAHGLDGPGELVAERLGEELLDRNLELVREDDRETRVDVVLGRRVSLKPS